MAALLANYGSSSDEDEKDETFSAPPPLSAKRKSHQKPSKTASDPEKNVEEGEVKDVSLKRPQENSNSSSTTPSSSSSLSSLSSFSSIQSKEPSRKRARFAPSSEPSRSVSTLLDQDNDDASMRLKRQLLEKMLLGEGDFLTSGEHLGNVSTTVEDANELRPSVVETGPETWLPEWASKRNAIPTSTSSSRDAPMPTRDKLSSGPRAKLHDSAFQERNSSVMNSQEGVGSQQSQTIWRSAVDKASGGTYYYDPKTRETRWELPEGAVVDGVSQEISKLSSKPVHANSMFSLRGGLHTSAATQAMTGSYSQARESHAGDLPRSSQFTERHARKLGKDFAGGDMSRLTKSDGLVVVDQRSNIETTAQVHQEAEKQRKIAEALNPEKKDGSNKSFGMVWNRSTGEFSKALRIGQRSKAKHQIHSLAAQALELRRRDQLAGQLPSKRKRHARHKYGF